MKTVAIGYMVSLLLGFPSARVATSHLDATIVGLSTYVTSAGENNPRPATNNAGEDTAPEFLSVKFQGAQTVKSLALLERVKSAGQETELKIWAANAPEARATLTAMRELPALADYTDWLSAQLDDMETVSGITDQSGVVFRVSETVVPQAVARGPIIPLFDVWLRRIQKRPYPARAKEFLPMVRAAFAAEGVPEALVWLAEAESTFNPRARNPVGARGLFQLMPTTARSLGLSLRPHDQRMHPATNARAAARYLKKLHIRFGSWPLALAAYNGGESRVARLLKQRRATDFAGIAEHLPAETRLYVPKVLATVQVRTGLAPSQLPAPSQS